MTLYTIRRTNNNHLVARGASHEDAANHVAHRLYGRKAQALRVTGVYTLSGMFQAYLPAKTGGQTSTGQPFHVQEQ